MKTKTKYVAVRKGTMNAVYFFNGSDALRHLNYHNYDFYSEAYYLECIK